MLDNVVKRSKFGYTREQRYTKVIYYYYVASCCLLRFSHACAECTFRHTVSRCGPQAVKQTITWVPVRASGCEPDHYLGSDDGPQAVKQTITWVLMTGLKL